MKIKTEKRLFCKILFLLTILIISQSISSQITKAPRKYVDLLVLPDRADWIYSTGEEAVVNIFAYAGGIPLNDVDVAFEVGNELMPGDLKGTVKIQNGKAMIPCGTMSVPGFRSCSVSFSYEGERYKEQVKIGFSPQDIQPTVEMPGDFREFWKTTVENAKSISANAEVTYLPDLSTDKVDVSLVKLQYYKEDCYFYGYLCKPKKEGKYPVLMTPPGAGIKRIQPSIEYAENGFISLTIEIHGLSPLADDDMVRFFNDSIGDYMSKGLDDKENYYFKKTYLACIRAMDYLCSLPEFDGINVGVCGGSQGGALSIVTAALDSRVTFLAAFYPALSDICGYLYGRAGSTPKLFSPGEISKLPVDVETAKKTLSYYDVVNFARILKTPGFYSFGYNDNTCPPTSVYAAINSITAPKKVVITPVAGHWRFRETNLKSIEWMKAECKVSE
jgi:cephalosporin-C deacetylase-like acetyl esterase